MFEKWNTGNLEGILEFWEILSGNVDQTQTNIFIFFHIADSIIAFVDSFLPDCSSTIIIIIVSYNIHFST